MNPLRGYGDATSAGTTTVGNADLVLTAMATGFQQSLGSQELEFVDQPAGPLGGTMRCGAYEVAPTAEGWLGWFTATEEGQTPETVVDGH